MVKIVNQNIPSELLDAYKRSLRQSTDWKPGANIYTVRTRQPFRLPHMQSDSGNSPSGAQVKIREAFSKCVDCYNNSPKTGGATPPAIGYRSKEWWYSAAGGSGLWYYDYFIQQTWPYFYGGTSPDWCKVEIPVDHMKDSYIKVDGGHSEVDFNDAWEETYTAWSGASWEETDLSEILYSYAWAIHIYEETWDCFIKTTKKTLVFKPVDYVSEAKWNSFNNVSIRIFRNLGENKAGGAIKLVETGEIKEQTQGWLTFNIPQNIRDYNEMEITFEGLCRDINDLKPDEPEFMEETRCGTSGPISGAKLFCSE